jgi:predicted AlkP superfamily pyrophosphatase or phosphodiesterase
VYVDKRSKVNPADIKRELEKIPGISHIYSTSEATQFGAAPNATFMIEARRGYYFVDEAIGEIEEQVNPAEIGQPERYKAVHGYSAKKNNYSTTIMFKGPGIAKGKVIDRANLVDEGPTFAKILGLDAFPQRTAGKAIDEIFDRSKGVQPSEIIE